MKLGSGILILALALGACSHSAPGSLVFSQTSRDGLVAFQLESKVGHPITFTIARFDVDSGRIDAFTPRISSGRCACPAER